MNLIIETDIGHDPDDFFALCYLKSAGVNIRAILVCPGDPDQIAIARFFCREVGLDIPIGVSKLNRTKLSSGSVHHYLLERYERSKIEAPDGLGCDILADTVKKYPDCELFIIGPASNVGAYLEKNPEAYFPRATMQGGFLPYSLHNFPCVRCEKFEEKFWVPTFNLNGDRKGGLAFINANIPDRQFVGKNVCHTVLFTKSEFGRLNTPIDRAGELFEEAMRHYLEHHEEKKFHDPTAAVCHLHPDVGYWVNGRPCKIESGWGTELGHNDKILAHIDYNHLWERVLNAN